MGFIPFICSLLIKLFTVKRKRRKLNEQSSIIGFFACAVALFCLLIQSVYCRILNTGKSVIKSWRKKTRMNSKWISIIIKTTIRIFIVHILHCYRFYCFLLISFIPLLFFHLSATNRFLLSVPFFSSTSSNLLIFYFFFTLVVPHLATIFFSGITYPIFLFLAEGRRSRS